METTVKWIDHMSFIAETGSGHMVAMDGPPDHGGRNLAARPMELLLAGMGGCTAFDVIQMLQKARQNVSACEVRVKADRADAIPAVFTRIHVHFVIRGKGISETQVKRAIELSAEKYCSASIMLSKSATITHDYELIEETA